MTNQFPVYVNTIMKALLQEGYEAYVVGGAVRDRLLGLEPMDYDITTNAHPKQVVEVAHKYNFRVVENMGQNMGVVLIVIDNNKVEVATYRGERYGNDPHKPEEVWFCETLQDDLSRRDFTVNAMALDIDEHLYDYCGGRYDIEKRVLRTVGDPKRRYEEDALRMYRACRFVAQLDFTYVETEYPIGMWTSDGSESLPPKEGFGQPDTEYYLPLRYRFNRDNCKKLSLERVRTELDKMLVSKAAGKGLMLFLACGLANTKCKVRLNGRDSFVPVLPELEHLEGLEQNPRFHCYNVWEHTLKAIDNAPRDLTLRWALLLHDVAKGLPGVRKPNKEGQPSDHGHEAQSAKIAEALLTRLGYGSSFVKRVTWLVAQHMRFAPMLITKEKTLLRWVRAEALSGTFRTEAELTEAYGQLVQVFLADMGATWAGRRSPELMAEGKALGQEVVQLAANRMPIHSSDLRLRGDEALAYAHKIVAENNISLEGLTETDTLGIVANGRLSIGGLLKYLLARVQSDSLANEKQALLEAIAKRLLKIKGEKHE